MNQQAASVSVINSLNQAGNHIQEESPVKDRVEISHRAFHVRTQAYLQNLGLVFKGQSVDFLRQMQAAHIKRYTFNNLAVILGQELPLDSDSVFNKIVDQGRGGYCFEHNKLSFDVLKDLGFTVRLLLARVLYNQEKDVPRTHRITLLTLGDKDYIVDTGFGHNCPRHPVELTPGKVQHIGNETFRIQLHTLADTRTTEEQRKNPARREYNLQIVKDGEFFTLYRFDLGSYTDADCLTGHFFSHRYPEAGFVNNLVVCQKNEAHVISLRNHELHEFNGDKTDITCLTSAEHLHQLLNNTFELETDIAVAEHLFARFSLPKLQESESDH
ncbi:arylamine N-acetyltransferase family protein [Oceanospirillum sediminis]|uniref:Arylamine N-acetyltransferase n=1 Tax=Oceanospirillum sediminis TaxID=2760088 RepID=A0A839IVT5_9GAMM|nr:arylamine N-acetyltransferase [Oceanospirillum sediminis]MBB1488734.1 arylamine N-acetyltransferase [Oceanospirillum sediminis]